MFNEYYHNDPYYDDGIDRNFDEEDVFETNYDSDTYFSDSDSEGLGKLVARCKKEKADQYAWDSRRQKSYEEFKYWELLPLELKEMITEKLDFTTWINFKICSGDPKEKFFLPGFASDIQRVSFYSNVIQNESKEMEKNQFSCILTVPLNKTNTSVIAKEHIRIRVHDGLEAVMVKIKEGDGYCKFTWNLNNRDAGSVSIPNCSYLKVAEKIMELFLEPSCGSFKFVVNKNKTDPSAQCVSKWPYFHNFVKKCIGIENDGRKFVDEQLIVDFVLEKPIAKSPVIDLSNWVSCELTLPNLDAKKVDSINEHWAEILAELQRKKPVKTDEEETVYKRYTVTQITENTININGPLSDYGYIQE